MIEPPACGRMILRASRLHKNVPVRLVSRILSQTSNGVSASSRFTGPPRGQANPALFTRISRRLNFSSVRPQKTTYVPRRSHIRFDTQDFLRRQSESRGGSVYFRSRKIADRDPCPFLRKSLNHLPTQPSRRSRDQSDLVVKFHWMLYIATASIIPRAAPMQTRLR